MLSESVRGLRLMKLYDLRFGACSAGELRREMDALHRHPDGSLNWQASNAAIISSMERRLAEVPSPGTLEYEACAQDALDDAAKTTCSGCGNKSTKGAKDTPLTTEQRELAARYFGFSQAEAVTVWHKSLHSGSSAALYVGDDEDARDIGTQALLRSCQTYPLSCNVCKGTGKHTSAVTGSDVCCGRCSGTGKPENQHKAFHAYLRVAIRTQVINEINKRTRDKTSAANKARREEEAAEAEAASEPGLSVRIYGARASVAGSRGGASELNAWF